MKIKPRKPVIICLITLIVISFIVEAIVIRSGYDWISKQFYILRCFQDLLLLMIAFFVSYNKIYKKNIVISKDVRLNPYHRAELIIVIITVILCVFEIFLEQWMKPGQRSINIAVPVAGICYLTIPLFLEQFALKPQEKKRKRGYIVMAVFGLIGAYMTLCFVTNFLVLFGILV